MKSLSILAVFLLGGFVAHGQSLLWKIEGPDLEVPSYLYGTLHLLCKEDLQLTPTLRDAFAETEQLVLELDMDDSNLFRAMQQNMVMVDGSELTDWVTEEEYETLSDFYTNYVGSGLGLLTQFKPIILQTFMVPKILGCNPVSYEEEFVRWAKRVPMEVEGLETIEYQMSLFDEISYEEQAEWLVASVENYAEYSLAYQQVVVAYGQQQLEETTSLMRESMFEYQQYGDKLIDQRNDQWLPVMQQYLESGPSFIAVGVVHLLGERGLINQLQKQGYTVTPVTAM